MLVFRREAGGTFYRRTWISGRNCEGSLRTTDRKVARERGEEFYRALVGGVELTRPTGPLTLGALWTAYKERSANYLGSTPHTQGTVRSQAKFLLEFFSATQVCELLTTNDTARYERARREGRIRPPGVQTVRPVRSRTVAGDLQLLSAMLNWACKERGLKNEFLLRENPIRDLVLPREEDVSRPVADYDSYLALDAKAAELAESGGAADRIRWSRLRLAMFAAEAFGRRIGSIRGLEWDDIRLDESDGFARAEIYWKPEFDKRGRGGATRISPAHAERLYRLRLQIDSTPHGWVFPKGASRGSGPVSSRQLMELLSRLFELCGLERRKGEGFHAFRRKWATERKHLPVKDTMAVGGWRDERTFRTCYEHVDEATTLRVIDCSVKLRGGRLVDQRRNSGRTMEVA